MDRVAALRVQRVVIIRLKPDPFTSYSTGLWWALTFGSSSARQRGSCSTRLGPGNKNEMRNQATMNS